MRLRPSKNRRAGNTLRASRAQDDPTGTPPRRRRTQFTSASAGIAAIAAIAGLVWVLPDGDGDVGASEPAGPRITAEVTRDSISDTRSFGGVLGHGSATTIAGYGQGTITGLADQGVPVERGTELLRVDERPVIAMIGDIPMYRDLGDCDTGADVTQLEANLAALGYDGFTVDDTYTSATAAAVERWQADLGLEPSGVVGRADVVFVAHPGRVDTRHARVGDVVSPGAPVLDVTGSEQIVGLEVDVSDREILSAGTDVLVQLPGGDAVAGTVTAANAVEAAGDGDGPGSDDPAGADDTIMAIEVTLTTPVPESFLGAPVDVVVEIDERTDVLTVPVNALLALAEGGHGLEVIAGDGTTSIIPVDTGLFADGRVEITGEGIEEGTTVVVAAR